jgi:hypothetical protein
MSKKCCGRKKYGNLMPPVMPLKPVNVRSTIITPTDVDSRALQENQAQQTLKIDLEQYIKEFKDYGPYGKKYYEWLYFTNLTLEPFINFNLMSTLEQSYIEKIMSKSMIDNPGERELPPKNIYLNLIIDTYTYDSFKSWLKFHCDEGAYLLPPELQKIADRYCFIKEKIQHEVPLYRSNKKLALARAGRTKTDSCLPGIDRDLAELIGTIDRTTGPFFDESDYYTIHGGKKSKKKRNNSRKRNNSKKKNKSKKKKK